jgi:hypothetical protein
VLANIAGQVIAFDLSVFCLDRQHYEGFLVSQEQLLKFVAQDFGPTGQNVANPANR